jgi:hypothetical protein
MKFLLQLLSDEQLGEKYLEAGCEYGLAIKDLPMGKISNFNLVLNRWSWLEQEYALRGYRTISLDDFICSGEPNKRTNLLLFEKRDEKENPFLYAFAEKCNMNLR